MDDCPHERVAKGQEIRHGETRKQGRCFYAVGRCLDCGEVVKVMVRADGRGTHRLEEPGGTTYTRRSR